MRKHSWLLGLLLLPVLFLTAAAQSPTPARTITWKRIVVDRGIRSEGAAIADINKDGKVDIIAGDVWYEAPSWIMHPIRTTINSYGDGAANYTRSFGCWAEDFNGDGYPDVLTINWPGDTCHWYENPKGQSVPWKEHKVWHSACNETPLYLDLLGNGKRVLVMATQPPGKEQEGQMAYFTPNPKDAAQPWEMHPISEPSQPGKEIPGTRRFSHGLGAGDVNGDGRLDVICKSGWWEQPAQQDGKPWTFHPAPLGDDCADMFAFDVDGDGKNDVVSSSAHRFGIWAHLQRPGKGADPTFVKQDLFPKLVSQTHALHHVDINGDGLKDLVTGKRWWAHGPRGDDDPNAPPKLYWFEAKKAADGTLSFTPHEIDSESGIGTQFTVGDLNGDGLPDIVVANKRGVHAFVQVREAPKAPAKPKTEAQAKSADGWRSLFNGKDLSGWETWLGVPLKGKEPIGLNKDPNKVYSIVSIDGQPAIRISGEVFGALTSTKEFENYHLKLEFKWGEKKWPPREDRVRDSGLLYHCVGPHGGNGANKAWMQSLECQIEEKDCGDFWSVAGVLVDVPAVTKGKTLVYEAGAPMQRGVKSRIIKSADYEKPGVWNTIELLSVGGTSVHLVNGQPNMVLLNSRRKVGDKEEPLTRGKLQLQSEAAEVYYRNIVVRPLKQIPSIYLGQ